MSDSSVSIAPDGAEYASTPQAAVGIGRTANTTEQLASCVLLRLPFTTKLAAVARAFPGARRMPEKIPRRSAVGPARIVAAPSWTTRRSPLRSSSARVPLIATGAPGRPDDRGDGAGGSERPVL